MKMTAVAVLALLLVVVPAQAEASGSLVPTGADNGTLMAHVEAGGPLLVHFLVSNGTLESTRLVVDVASNATYLIVEAVSDPPGGGAGAAAHGIVELRGLEAGQGPGLPLPPTCGLIITSFQPNNPPFVFVTVNNACADAWERYISGIIGGGMIQFHPGDMVQAPSDGQVGA